MMKIKNLFILWFFLSILWINKVNALSIDDFNYILTDQLNINFFSELTDNVNVIKVFEYKETANNDEIMLKSNERYNREKDWILLKNNQLVINFLYKQGITKFDTEKTFWGNRSIRRDEAAAFFTRFAKYMWVQINNSKICKFNDLNNWISDLRNSVIEACQMWIINWSNWKFFPNSNLTNWEALVILTRIIDWSKIEDKQHFALNYFIYAKSVWLTNWLWINWINELNKNINRINLWKLLEWWFYIPEIKKILDWNIQFNWSSFILK